MLPLSPAAGSSCLATGGEEGEEEMKQAVEAIAELALLGVGSADLMYPKTLDEVYAAYGNDEMEWRVVL